MAFPTSAMGLLWGAVLVAPAVAWAGERGPLVYDMREVLANPGRHVAEPVVQPDLSQLGKPQAARAPLPPGQLPPGWVQLGEVVQREEIARGLKGVDPRPSQAFEDTEGNQYPRKGTVFLNFNGGVLKLGDDNSAESKSTLARPNLDYPVFSGAESTALALVQAVQENMASLGVRVVYLQRPNKTVPYTMAMIGGDWTDTNIPDPAGGVAPGTDCEDRDQRNVVYVFDRSASTTCQEVAHAWGLDHTLGSDRIMSYMGGLNKKFGDNCQPLCEEACQGPGSIGCRQIHEIYCGVDSGQQNDLAELGKVFGTNEPDTEPPTVEISEPAEEVLELPTGGSVGVRAKIHDNYGGVGWKLTVSKDGEVIFDEVDYERIGGWDFTGLPDGSYEIVLEAEDHADHIVQDRLKILGGEAAQATGGETDTEGGSSGGESGSSGVDSATATAGGEGEKGGCECRSTASGGASGALWLPLAGLWAFRVRRRRR